MPVSSLRDLWRSRKQYALSLTAAMISFSIVAFTVMLGDSLGAYIGISTLTRVSSGFRGVLSTFILITIAFSVLASIVIFSNLTATMMNLRARDMAIVKTSGGSIHRIYSHFMTQSIQLSFLAGLGGIVIGILLSGAANLITGFFFGVQLHFSIPVPQLGLALALLVICGTLFSRRHVIKAARLSVAETLSPQIYERHMLSTEGWFEKRISKPGSPMRIAFRNSRRTKPLTRRLATCIFVVMVLTTTITVGGIIGDQTTANYVQRAISDQFIFVGHPDVWNQYSAMIGFQASPLYNSSFNYMRTDYGINESTVSQISLLPGVEAVDPRIIYETQLDEIKVPVIIDGQYRIIGDDRHSRVLVNGVKLGYVISDWIISGRFLNASDYPPVPRAYSSIVIGDSLQTTFDDVSIQKASILGKDFAIVGVALDPVDSGNSVYMLHDVLGSLLGFNESNMLLVKCGAANYEDTFSLIQSSAGYYGLSAYKMRTVVTNLISFVHSTWLVALVPAALLLLTMFLSVVGYMNLVFEAGKRDFGVMRGVGASPRCVRKTVLMQGIIVSTWPGFAGIVFGLIVSMWFFIPFATWSISSIGVAVLVLMLVLLLASVAASLVSSRVSRKPAADIIR